MQSLKKLIDICNQYKKGDFDIEEFQSRIMDSQTPENASKQLIEQLKEFDNLIEKIIYCELPATWNGMGAQVADMLIQDIQEEINRREK